MKTVEINKDLEGIKMKNKIVTLDETDKWFLSDETEQNNIKYYLGLKLNDNNKPSDETKIFMEEHEGEDTYLTEVTDKDIYNYLSAIFITRFDQSIEN